MDGDSPLPFNPFDTGTNEGGRSDQNVPLFTAPQHYQQQQQYAPQVGMNGQGLASYASAQAPAASGASHQGDSLMHNSFSDMSAPADLDHSFSSLGGDVQPDQNNAASSQARHATPAQHQPAPQSLPTTNNPLHAVAVTPAPPIQNGESQMKPAAAAAAPPQDDDDDVIEILEDEDGPPQQQQQQQQTHQQQQQHHHHYNQQQQPSKRARYTNSGSMAVMPPTLGMTNSYQNRAAYTSSVNIPMAGNSINPGQTLNGYNQNQHNMSTAYRTAPGIGYGAGGYAYSQPQQCAPPQQQHAAAGYDPSKFDVPQYLKLPEEFVPTWKKMVPDELVAPPRHRGGKKAWKLSLVGLSEFTITGLQVSYDAPPTPIAGLRPFIKRVSREHGQATFEKDAGGVGGKWKIPLGAYHAFVAYLQSDPNCVHLETIPQMQLKIASLGKARLERDYPTPEKLIQRGVPYALAKTLAPFQRGGVDFVLERDGRALIADEMGLGKTIQSIASMSVYHKEWPLLILTPSGARYHWEAEFRNWLGVDGAAVKKAEEQAQGQERVSSTSILLGNDKSFNLLRDSQIHVLTSSKVKVLPNKGTKVVICSYGLAPMLAQNKQIVPGMFRCAIADESHMMKNSKSKRTQFLLPVLKACKRCVLLSGTPAFSKPVELWPQLQILASERGFWDSEADFVDKYVKNGNTDRRAELHAMLTGTLMIRRLKDDILKDMPKKAREKAILRVESSAMRSKMQECMMLLRQGKGVMAKLARKHAASTPLEERLKEREEPPPANTVSEGPTPEQSAQSLHLLLNGQRHISATPAEAALDQEMLSRYQNGQLTLQHAINTSSHQMSPVEIQTFVGQRDHQLRMDLQVEYHERMLGMHQSQNGQKEEEEAPTRATVLNKMYSLTGECKIPMVSKFLAKWLADPAKGKICVFAHHISVLDAIGERVGLSNSGKAGTFKFIRIDGKTTPKTRQEQIERFQNDPSVRVAMLGITAAGVAVTLTAASEVLFAELFWTPALMIQAEDRCHRIGQRARVHCKYFVAAGTLDEILWRLLEKKFQELGEFVEGKEKLKMTVSKVFKSEEELFKIFEYEDEEGDDPDEGAQADQVGSVSSIMPLDQDIEHDIEELAKEEQAMLLGDRDEDDPDEPISISSQAATGPTVAVQETGPGRSEDDAIALSDDEDDGDIEASTPLAVDLSRPGSDLNVAGALPQCRVYKLTLKGPQLGVEVGLYKDRLVVSKRTKSRLARLGENCKPHVGDVLVAIDTTILPPVQNLDPALKFLKKMLTRPQPATLWFVEDADFQEFYKKVSPPKKPQREKVKPKPTDEVVELLDD